MFLLSYPAYLFPHSDARSPHNIGFFLCLKPVQRKHTAAGFEDMKLPSSKADSSEHEWNSVKIAHNGKKNKYYAECQVTYELRRDLTKSHFQTSWQNGLRDFENGCYGILILQFWFYSRGWSKVTKGCYYQTLWVNAVKIKWHAIGKKNKRSHQ